MNGLSDCSYTTITVLLDFQVFCKRHGEKAGLFWLLKEGHWGQAWQQSLGDLILSNSHNSTRVGYLLLLNRSHPTKGSVVYWLEFQV